jgi:hypothetical protein
LFQQQSKVAIAIIKPCIASGETVSANKEKGIII